MASRACESTANNCSTRQTLQQEEQIANTERMVDDMQACHACGCFASTARAFDLPTARDGCRTFSPFRTTSTPRSRSNKRPSMKFMKRQSRRHHALPMRHPRLATTLQCVLWPTATAVGCELRLFCCLPDHSTTLAGRLRSTSTGEPATLPW